MTKSISKARQDQRSGHLPELDERGLQYLRRDRFKQVTEVMGEIFAVDSRGGLESGFISEVLKTLTLQRSKGRDELLNALLENHERTRALISVALETGELDAALELCTRLVD